MLNQEDLEELQVFVMQGGQSRGWEGPAGVGGRGDGRGDGRGACPLAGLQ